MIAILSDIHANLEAFTAVLDDIEQREVEDIICLGDIVGYGANPIECLGLAARCKFAILGNHEEGVLSEEGSRNFTARAKSAIEWTRKRLAVKGKDEQESSSIAFLKRLERTHEEGDVFFTHGSPLKPTRDYVFPKDAANKRKMAAIFARIKHVCFVGHTHLPGVFEENGSFTPPDEYMGVYMIDKQKAMINVGSVGQPRDSDPRASYVTFEDDAVVFRRVEYNYRETMRKIRAVKDLHNTLADRLEKGI